MAIPHYEGSGDDKIVIHTVQEIIREPLKMIYVGGWGTLMKSYIVKVFNMVLDECG